MSKYLATFSGRYGDILWSLPTVRELSKLVGSPLDFIMMPEYASLIPLLDAQSYIDKAAVLGNWFCYHSNFGDQPWNPPVDFPQYEKVWHLGYRVHPDRPLIAFTAYQQGIGLPTEVMPFIEVPGVIEPIVNAVAVAYNDQYLQIKQEFFGQLKEMLEAHGLAVFQTNGMDWCTAARTMKESFCYVGDKSSNHVLAHAVGQKNVFIYEPHPAKHPYGSLGPVFGCPYVTEYTSATQYAHESRIENEVQIAMEYILNWKKEYDNANAAAKSR